MATGWLDDFLSTLLSDPNQPGGTGLMHFLGVTSPTASTQTPTIVPSSGGRPPLTLGSPMLGGAPAAASGGLLGGQGLLGTGQQGALGNTLLGKLLGGAMSGLGSVQPGQTGLAALGAGFQGATTAADTRRQEQIKNWYMQNQVAQTAQNAQAKQQQAAYVAAMPAPPGIDPAQWKAYVQADPEGAMALAGKTMTPDKPTHSGIYNEYQDAVASGYKGSFIDYQNEDANRKRSISHTTNITKLPPTMEERDRQILLTGDPSSPEYAAAWDNHMRPRVTLNPDGTVSTVTPPPPTWARPPTYGAPAAAGGTATPATTSDGTMPPPVTSSEVSGGPAAGGTTAPPAAGGTTATPPAGPTVTTTGTPKPKAPTEQQAAASGYAARTRTADKQLEQLLRAGYRPSLKDITAAQSGVLGNYVISDQGRQFDQAKRNFINAVLRRESGAAISASEFDNANVQYFPMPNDDAGTLAMKAENRRQAIAAIDAAAGPKSGDTKWIYKDGKLVPEGMP